MPVMRCQKDNRPGFKYGERGTCYPYTPGDSQSRGRARAKAERQGRAMRAGGYRG